MCHDPAIANQIGRLFEQCLLQYFCEASRRLQIEMDVMQQLGGRQVAQSFLQVQRQIGRADEGIFKRNQFTRAHLSERNARCDALDIAGAFELLS